MGQFVAECCQILPGVEIKAGPLHKRYVAWVQEQGGKEPLPPPVLSQRLSALGTARGFVRARTGDKGRYWKGLGLIEVAQERGEPEERDEQSYASRSNGRGW